MVDGLLKINPLFKSYHFTRGTKIDLHSLAKMVNQVGHYESEILILNEGLGPEYTSSNKRLRDEMPTLAFTPHIDAIRKIYDYHLQNRHLIDEQKIKEDRYLQECAHLWKRS